MEVLSVSWDKLKIWFTQKVKLPFADFHVVSNQMTSYFET